MRGIKPLPIEILIQIFDYVDSSYFRADLSRLIICRQRSKLAQIACFQDLHLKPRTLQRLGSSPHTASSLPLVKDIMETLDLDLEGFDEEYSVPRSTPRQYMSAASPCFRTQIRPFLLANSLTSLNLDLYNARLVHQRDQVHVEEFHICTLIAAHLATLRHSIDLRLKEVIINLSRNSPRSMSAGHASCCEDIPGGLVRLKAGMEEQARVLAAQMAAPKMVRILTHMRRQGEMRAFDVLTGKTLALSKDAERDGDGKEVS
ncbi:hypothetical protein BU23DRAFT_652724 [Bimuria novae-zelandiae CBS 107.79]|uniref:F-box domain-containing protein n=1 Tax=Bimuria novae-zelandiae CBS 107.79 TaxID=1447943 RepID=A0A6A5V8G2_9PLEO|nr:hypothetical protein BU23DRAFT_652724 [Bimuria novae-zelandiae CBS 107.79]